VIDNCGLFGDALLEIPGDGNVCSVSSLSGALIGQMLTVGTIKNLLARDITPLVYLSANIPGGIEQGELLRRRYAGRVN